jgi:hypothetical protein
MHLAFSPPMLIRRRAAARKVPEPATSKFNLRSTVVKDSTASVARADDRAKKEEMS